MKTFTDPESFARVKCPPFHVCTVTARLRDDAIDRAEDQARIRVAAERVEKFLRGPAASAPAERG